jgi:hypothetical protein
MVEALFAMSEAQRAHYNMKEGFTGDAKNVHSAADLFASLPGETRRRLEEGFGKDIAGLYEDG